MYSLKRWIYRGNRPNWIAHLLNKVWEAFHSSSLGPRNWVTLEVIGRKSGKIISFPGVAAIVAEQRYLVSMLGNEAQWVQNAQAAQGKAFIRKAGRTEVRLESVPVEELAAILKEYLQCASDKIAVEQVASIPPVLILVRYSEFLICNGR